MLLCSARHSAVILLRKLYRKNSIAGLEQKGLQRLHMITAAPTAAAARITLACIVSDDEPALGGGHKVVSWASVKVALGIFRSRTGTGSVTSKARAEDKAALHLSATQTLTTTLKPSPSAALIPPLRVTSKRRPMTPTVGILSDAPGTA